ncbi:TPA: glycine amidinotransferase [Vibrio vulnificus]|uniref:hypothetical protein n=1 Tax=Vibrio vulnificus TaxID=672 RepID=UPI001A2E2C66|nr:hypothetical protein [Vibrio vulnificus]MCA3928085.1 hypothetical protein [Vibrio vulnificus]HAS8451203.1 glycine amidinotransferase [Vibrio vulnificus]
MQKPNSHNEWDPLKEVIVGSAENYLSHDRELSFDIFFHENIFKSDWAYPRLKKTSNGTVTATRQEINHRYVRELHEDVENLALTLKKLGVVVHRPKTLPKNADTIKGFGWEATPIPALNIRDNTVIIGDEIIETPPAIRSRYLETRLMAEVFQDYFESGGRWTTMPRPIMTDCSFDTSYAKKISSTLGGPTEPIENVLPSEFDVGFEMMLDGAQILRLGKDLIVNVANENHNKAFNWLKRHLEHKYRVHKVIEMSDNHIDSMILALKPGVFLARHAGIKNFMPDAFKNWKYIIPPEPKNFPKYNDGELILTSPYIDINVLSINESDILVNSECDGLISCLDKNGFNPIPVQHRHRRLFGGGFHCFTLDTVREGELLDYSN